MTTVIAHVDKDHSYILSDGRISGNQITYDSRIPKFIKFNGEETFYVCLSGRAKALNLLNYKLRELEQGSKCEMGYLNFELFPKIIKLFEANEIKTDECNFLFVGEGGIYHSQSLESLTHVDSDYFCTGSGSDIVLGAMEILKKDKSLSVRDRLLEAMRIATKLDTYTGKPYYLINIKTSTEEIFK